MAKFSFLVLLPFLITSCATSNVLTNVEMVSGKELVAFGRIKVIQEGKSIEWPRLGGFRSFVVRIIPDAGPEPRYYVYPLEGDGSFYWHVLPGSYMITEFRYTYLPHFLSLRHTEVRRAILARFVVLEITAPVYVGTLVIRSEGDEYIIRVEDQYDEAMQGLTKRFPEFQGSVAKRLMQLEPR